MHETVDKENGINSHSGSDHFYKLKAQFTFKNSSLSGFCFNFKATGP